MILSPYLFFNGQCEAAFEFYKNVFNGEIIVLNRFEGSPMEYPQDYGQKIMHEELIFENNRIQGADNPDRLVEHNSSLSLSFVEVFIMDDVFNKLSEGGTVTMPLQDTFWGARFGMIKDKFGIQWMFNCDLN